MSSVNEWIVREYFESLGFLVRQPRKYQVAARARMTPQEEVDLLVINPLPGEGPEPELGVWGEDQLRRIHRAVVGVRGWHTERFSPAVWYHQQNGEIICRAVTVAWQLADGPAGAGGFCCIPGTHKANLPLPEKWCDLSKGIPPSVKRVPARPGDAIIFTEALTHRTIPWTTNAVRRTVFYKFYPHGTSWGGNYFHPEEFCNYKDIDKRKMAILEPPNARYASRPTRPNHPTPNNEDLDELAKNPR